MNKKILLIDDDCMSNFVSRRFLQREFPESEVVTFSGGKSALDYLRLNSGQEDLQYLIFLDINMPVISGWRFLEMFEETFPELNARVVMLTSSIDYNDREKASTYRPVAGFLSKPLGKSNLDMLGKLIEGELEAASA